jgi:signal transduction histidine kinase
MVAEILFVALVVVVALLMVVDLRRGPSESAHGQADGRAYETRRTIVEAPRDTRATAPTRGPAGIGIAAAAHSADRSWQPESTSSSAGGHRRPATWSAANLKDTSGALKNWPVGLRLSLLMIIPAVAASILTLSVSHIVSSLQSTAIHSQISSVHNGAITSALVAGVIVIIILALALASMTIVAKSMLGPLHRLRSGALEVAGAQLPDAVRLINDSGGEGVPQEVKPIDVDSSDEIGDVARAFDQVHREALRMAADQAAIRGKLNAILVNLSRRSQSLVERQIRLIDDLEQGEQHADRLARLFKLDHLTIRMRRYSHNLLVLAGHELPDYSDRPVELVNVIKAAVSEIEEYERVSLRAQPGIAVRGPAVNDVVHLLAELTENAASLSPADTSIVISGRQLASGGVLVDIIDQGFGMSAQEMAQANWRLENPPATDVAVSKSMGLFVVGRLAARHGIKVRLNPAEAGGLTALVWLPDALIIYQDEAPSSGLSGVGSTRSRQNWPASAGLGRLDRVDPDRATAE